MLPRVGLLVHAAGTVREGAGNRALKSRDEGVSYQEPES
jgi:hypothetical protein